MITSMTKQGRTALPPTAICRRKNIGSCRQRPVESQILQDQGEVSRSLEHGILGAIYGPKMVHNAIEWDKNSNCQNPAKSPACLDSCAAQQALAARAQWTRTVEGRNDCSVRFSIPSSPDLPIQTTRNCDRLLPIRTSNSTPGRRRRLIPSSTIPPALRLVTMAESEKGLPCASRPQTSTGSCTDTRELRRRSIDPPPSAMAYCEGISGRCKLTRVISERVLEC